MILKKLTEEDFFNAAKIIGCEVPVIKAVCEVEAPRGGFQKDGKCVILFEPYIFGELTAHKFSQQEIIIDNIHYPLSLNKRQLPWNVKNAKYGTYDIQHRKLECAAKFDYDAAHKSCSWGRFQILGDNYKHCGFNTLNEFITAMNTNEAAHLDAFIKFIIHQKLDDELISKNWIAFALKYNGPKQDKGTADIKDDYSYLLKKAYNKFITTK